MNSSFIDNFIRFLLGKMLLDAITTIMMALLKNTTMTFKDYDMKLIFVVQTQWNARLISNITIPFSKKIEYTYSLMDLMIT
ncbi:hypothetical protein CR513_04479, partial [Mucuna pruriens]